MKRPGALRAAVAGDRGVGLVVAAVCALGLLALLIGLLVPRPYFTGTNSVRDRGYVLDLPPGEEACVVDLAVPAGTAQVRMSVLSGGPRPPLEGTLKAGGRTERSTVPGQGFVGATRIDFPIERRPESPEAVPGEFCLRNLAPPGGPGVSLGGAYGVPPYEVATTLQGVPENVLLAVWFRPPDGAERSALAQMPDIMRRAALFRAGWVGPWTGWVLVFLVVPLLAFALLRLMARAAAGKRGRVPLGLAVALVAFGNAAAWATITPSFNAPDESEHFAYAQYVAETGNSIDRVPQPGRGPYSGEEGVALDTTRMLASNEPGDGRPPWLERNERRFYERIAAERPPRDDGGGFTVCCNPHSPVYYALLSPAYAAGSDASIFTRLWLMRLTSALLAALAAACAFGIVRELIPDRPELAVAGGILVAFQPMFAFMGGTVNNDMGVNGGSALVLYLLIRGLRRGLTWRLAIALGAALAVLPLLKGTGYALFPIAAFAVLGMLWRASDRRRALLGAALAVAALVVVSLIWLSVASTFDRGTFTTPGGTVPGEGLAPLERPANYLSYLWQIFLPKLPFMTDLWLQSWPFYDIYVVRGWGAFGWYQVLFPRPLFALIVLWLAVTAALGIAAVLRPSESARKRVWEVLVLLGAGAAIIAGVEAFYTVTAPRGVIVAEMGRYAFPAISAFAALAIAACFGAGRGRAGLVAAAFAAAMVVLNTAGQLVSLAGFYT